MSLTTQARTLFPGNRYIQARWVRAKFILIKMGKAPYPLMPRTATVGPVKTRKGSANETA